MNIGWKGSGNAKNCFDFIADIIWLQYKSEIIIWIYSWLEPLFVLLPKGFLYGFSVVLAHFYLAQHGVVNDEKQRKQNRTDENKRSLVEIDPINTFMLFAAIVHTKFFLPIIRYPHSLTHSLTEFWRRATFFFCADASELLLLLLLLLVMLFFSFFEQS